MLYDRMLFVITLRWHKRHLAVDESYDLHAKSVKAQVSNNCHYHSWHAADAILYYCLVQKMPLFTVGSNACY